jgi:hypothetical protein
MRIARMAIDRNHRDAGKLDRKFRSFTTAISPFRERTSLAMVRTHRLAIYSSGMSRSAFLDEAFIFRMDHKILINQIILINLIQLKQLVKSFFDQKPPPLKENPSMKKFLKRGVFSTRGKEINYIFSLFLPPILWWVRYWE